MKRYLATFFRGIWIYVPVLSLMVIAATVGGLRLGYTKYDATAHVWIEKPALSAVLGLNAQQTYPPPPDLSQQQADALNQLLQSNSFVTEIIKRAPGAFHLAQGQTVPPEAIDTVRQGMQVMVLGPNTLMIAFTAPDANLAEQTVQATFDQYSVWLVSQELEQRLAERQYYLTQLTAHGKQLNAAKQAVADAERQFPKLDPSDNPNSVAPQTLDLERLQRELETAQAQYAQTQAKLDELGPAEVSPGDGRLTRMRLLDLPASYPQPLATRVTSLLAYVLIGAMAGLVAVLAAVAIVTWRDTSIRTLDDLERLVDVPVIEALPHFSGTRRRGRLPDAGASHGEIHAPAVAFDSADAEPAPTARKRVSV